MDALELIMAGKTDEAMAALLHQANSENKNDAHRNLLLLKSNLKKAKRENRLGLITLEDYNVVFAKTNQYLIDYVREDKLDIDTNEIQPKFKKAARIVLTVGSIMMMLFSLLILYLRRDILEQIISYQHFDVDIYRLIFPTLLFFGGIYIFIKTRNHA